MFLNPCPVKRETCFTGVGRNQKSPIPCILPTIFIFPTFCLPQSAYCPLIITSHSLPTAYYFIFPAFYPLLTEVMIITFLCFSVFAFRIPQSTIVCRTNTYKKKSKNPTKKSDKHRYHYISTPCKINW